MDYTITKNPMDCAITGNPLYDIIHKFNKASNADTKHQLLIDFVVMSSQQLPLENFHEIIKRFISTDRFSKCKDVSVLHIYTDEVMVKFVFDLKFLNNPIMKYETKFNKQSGKDNCFMWHRKGVLDIQYKDINNLDIVYQNSVPYNLSKKRRYEY